MREREGIPGNQGAATEGISASQLSLLPGVCPTTLVTSHRAHFSRATAPLPSSQGFKDQVFRGRTLSRYKLCICAPPAAPLQKLVCPRLSHCTEPPLWLSHLGACGPILLPSQGQRMEPWQTKKEDEGQREDCKGDISAVDKNKAFESFSCCHIPALSSSPVPANRFHSWKKEAATRLHCLSA